MENPSSPVIPLQLRRDRGYVYFPDAIESCLRHFSSCRPEGVRAECYKISDRQIRAQELSGEFFDRRDPEIFGTIFWRERGLERQLILREELTSNPARYDLPEPVFDFKLSEMQMKVGGESSFPTVFHRWAACCKRLYHHADPSGGRRMLLQRMETFNLQDRANETFKLEFMTPERFMKFSVLQNGKLAGEVIAAAREMS